MMDFPVLTHCSACNVSWAAFVPDQVGDALSYAAYGLAWDDAVTSDFADQAIYLADLVASVLPEQAEPAGLLALTLFCQARQAARSAAGILATANSCAPH